MSPACKSWDLIVMGCLEQTSHANAIFISITKVKACWRIIITCCLKNWMQKDKDKWPPNHLLWKRWAHSLMKQSISCLGAPCMTHPQLLEGLQEESRVEDSGKREGVGVHSLTHSTRGVEGRAGAPGLGLGRVTSLIHLLEPASNQPRGG
jgi:hypothetical protein